MNTRSYLDGLSESFRRNWELPALSDYKGQSNTYAEVATKIARLHLIYKEFGLKKGDKVSIVGRNEAQWAISFLSILTYGAVAVPIAHEYKPENIHNVVNHSESRLLLSGALVWNDLDIKEMPSLEGVVLISDFSLLSTNNPLFEDRIKSIDSLFVQTYGESFNKEDINYHHDMYNELAIINYTSGTTGSSKGVMIPYRALWSNTDYIREKMPYVKPGEKIVSMLPLSHMYGLTCDLLFEILHGCHIYFLNRTPTPQLLLQAFSEIRPILICTVPLVLEKMYKKQISPILKKPMVRVILKLPLLRKQLYKAINRKLTAAFGNHFEEVALAGAPVNPEVELFLNRIGFRYTVGYGMTECAPLISFEQWDRNHLYACGKPVERMEVRIDSPDPQNIPGEIITRGDNVMLGYYKNEEATNAVLKDGWLYTGDLGLLDKNNFLHIKGRIKNVIIGPSGQNIYPEDIEGLLNNMDYVSESLVLERKGKIVALIYPDYEQVRDEKMNEQEIREALELNRKIVNGQLPSYSQVGEIEIRTEEFEKTPKKSIKRFAYK